MLGKEFNGVKQWGSHGSFLGRRDRFVLLSRISGVLLRARGNEIYPEVLSLLLDVTQSRYGAFGYIDGNGDCVCPLLYGRALQGRRLFERATVFYRSAWAGLWKRSLLEKKSFFSNVPAEISQTDIPVRRSMCIPVICEDRLVCLFYLTNKKSEYASADKKRAQFVVDHFSALLESRLEKYLLSPGGEGVARGVCVECAEEPGIVRVASDKGSPAAAIDWRRRAEDALREGETPFRSVFENSRVGISIVDLNFKFVKVNQAYCNMLGYTREELTKLTILDVTHPEDNTMSLEKGRQLFQGLQGGFNCEKRYIRKDGGFIWGHLHVSVVRDSLGSPIYAVGLLENIDERKKAEEALIFSEKRFRDMFENVAIGVVLTNLEGWLLNCNRAMYNLLGYTREELCCMDFTQFTHPDDVEISKMHFRRLAEGRSERCRFEKRYLHKGGYSIWSRINASLIRDHKGAPQFFITTIEDITQRKEAQKKLQHTMEELAASNNELKQFVSVASHDLKEPLRMVTSYLQLLKKRYQEELDDEADEFISYAVGGAERMYALINALLAYSHVSMQEKTEELTDCNEVLRQVLRNIKQTVEERRGRVRVADGGLPAIMADTVQVSQLLQNLIVNAIKFNRSGAPAVEVAAADKGHEWLFSVTDNGVGIAPEFKERIFKMFQRLHTRAVYPGTGIGLAICKKIVERHGGRIWVDSVQGEGTTFYFTIPKKERSRYD